MAINKADRYPGRWETESSEYPMGKPKNRTSESSKDGTYFEKDWLTDYEAFFGSVMNEAGFSPNGIVDTAEESQIFDAFIASRSAVNRFKGNQNFNVQGADRDLPSASAITYLIGEEVAYNILCVDNNLVNATYENGLFDADSGSYMREYGGDFTGDFFGIKLDDNSIVQTGVSVALVSGNTQVTVDMSIAPAHKFIGLSSDRGVWPDVSDDDSTYYLLEYTQDQIDSVTKNRIIENYLKPNQNLNVPYGDAVLPNAVAEDYTAGDVFAYNYEAVTNIVGLTRTSGITSGTSGTYMRSYKGDFSSSFFGVQLTDGTVSQTGVDIDYNARKAGYTTVAVDVDIAPDHYCVVLSPAQGRVAVVNDTESAVAIGGAGVKQTYIDVTGDRSVGVTYTNTTGRTLAISITSNKSSTGAGVSILVDSDVISDPFVNGDGLSSSFAFALVPPDSDYRVESIVGVSIWTELRG